MESKWYHLKESALQLRKRGLSIGMIEHKLGISRSTLSGWFKNIELSHVQKEQLLQNWRDGLVHARKKAVIWHNAQKKQRLEEAKKQAIKTLAGIDEKNKMFIVSKSRPRSYKNKTVLGRPTKTSNKQF